MARNKMRREGQARELTENEEKKSREREKEEREEG